ncbi:MAG: hypothetical protein ACK5GU_10785 [Chloroflexota bacterium]|jgi:hypothetical protein
MADSDKLSNSQSILHNYRALGDEVRERFKSKKEGSLWYYRALANACMAAPNNYHYKALVEELNRVVSQIK